jgi:glycosyltransferase involved in cell wall biosynthesis
MKDLPMESAASSPHLVMLGTSFETRGGVSAVVNVYRQHGLFARWPIVYLATHCDGHAGRKFHLALKSFVRFLGLVLAGRVAAVHVHSSSYASFWRKSGFLLVAIAARRPVIFHLHGGDFLAFHNGLIEPARRFVRFLLGRASYVVVLSREWQTWMQEITDNPRLVVVPNPVLLPQASGEARRPSDLLFLGRMIRDKGIYDLLEVMVELRSVQPDVRLICGGDGETERVKARARELGIDDAVNVIGWMGAAEKQRHLATCGVLVLPSYLEGLPMSVLESMAAGTPVVATPVGGIPQAIEDGVEGLLVAPGDLAGLRDALELLLARPALQDQMGARGRNKVERLFSAQSVVPKIETLYRTLGVAPAAYSRGASAAERPGAVQP